MDRIPLYRPAAGSLTGGRGAALHKLACEVSAQQGDHYRNGGSHSAGGESDVRHDPQSSRERIGLIAARTTIDEYTMEKINATSIRIADWLLVCAWAHTPEIEPIMKEIQ